MGRMSYSNYIKLHFTALLAFCLSILSLSNLESTSSLHIKVINNHHMTKFNGHFSKVILISQQHFLPFNPVPFSLSSCDLTFMFSSYLTRGSLSVSFTAPPSLSKFYCWLASEECPIESQTQRSKGKGRKHKELHVQGQGLERTEHLQARPQSLQPLAFTHE